MNLFETQEFEIKTRRTKGELLQTLNKSVDCEGERFGIESSPYGLGYTFAIGEIQTSENQTIVLLKMYPSMILKILTYALAGRSRMRIHSLFNKGNRKLKYESGIHLTIGFSIIGLIVSQMAFRQWSEIQYKSIRKIIKE
jgi:hypothetical protein